jgi:exopolyphosphatase/guanosine-5'-triphosphate,3'-diphosphate pyrophosphatase
MLVLLDDRTCTFRAAEGEHVAALGTAVLGAALTGDPPRADDLSNAIGAVHDVLDDVLRELPAGVADADIDVAGAAMTAIADIEVGAAAALPFEISRDAAEDVFRTVATERRADRARNPGLTPDQVDAVVPAACVLVGLMRRLQLDRVRIVTTSPDDDGTP